MLCAVKVGWDGEWWGWFRVGLKIIYLSKVFSLLLKRQQPVYNPADLNQMCYVIISIDLVPSTQREETQSTKNATCLDKIEEAHCVYCLRAF